MHLILQTGHASRYFHFRHNGPSSNKLHIEHKLASFSDGSVLLFASFLCRDRHGSMGRNGAIFIGQNFMLAHISIYGHDVLYMDIYMDKTIWECALNVG